MNNIGNSLLRDSANITLSYNPLLTVGNNMIESILHPDIILIGEGSVEAGDMISQIHKKMCQNKDIKICRMTPSSAEIARLGINSFLSIKISFANLIGDLCAKTPTVDQSDVLGCIGLDSRIGSKYLSYGWSYGGPNLHNSTKLLRRYMDSVGIDPILLQATHATNNLHIDNYVNQLIIQLDNDKSKSFIVNGCGYKEPCAIPIIEESAKLKIAREIAKRGYTVIISDTKPMLDLVRQEYGNIFQYSYHTE